MHNSIRAITILSFCLLLPAMSVTRAQTTTRRGGYAKLCVLMDVVGCSDEGLNTAIADAGYSRISSDIADRLAAGVSLNVRMERIPAMLGVEFTMLSRPTQAPSYASLLSILSGLITGEGCLDFGDHLTAHGGAGIAFGSGALDLAFASPRIPLPLLLVDTSSNARTLSFQTFNALIAAGADYAIPYDTEREMSFVVGLRGWMNILQVAHAAINGQTVAMPGGTMIPSYQIGLQVGAQFGL